MMGNRPQLNFRTVQPSALHYSPGLQRRDLPPIVLAQVLPFDRTSALDDSGVAEFYVTTPEVRCRIKGALIWVPNLSAGEVDGPDDYWIDPSDGSHRNRFGATALWLAKRECGILGSCNFVPVENLSGDIYNGEPIPDVGDMGYIFEVETTAEQVWGRMLVSAAGGETSAGLAAGQWVLKCAADAMEPISEPEWQRVCTRFACIARGLQVLGVDTGPPS